MGLKSGIKNIAKKLPVTKDIFQKIETLKAQNEELENEVIALAFENVSERIRKKAANGERINVVFLVWRPATWESLHSVYDALNNDKQFDVKIVAIPNKKELPKLGLSHEEYESEGAEQFWKPYGCINGYDYDTKKWLDLAELKPDYVFIQQPYNIARPQIYNSRTIARYAHICYVSYFNFLSVSEVYDECTPLDFMHDVSMFFTQNGTDQEYISERLEKSGNKVGKAVLTGYPRYDQTAQYHGCESELWMPKCGRYRILWTPRWTTNEGNCHFFDYKDEFTELCTNNDAVDFVFRPHPQAFKEWAATGELTEKQQAEYRGIFEKNENMHIDETANYMKVIYSSDCLVTDRSSMMMDYFLTGKPIIYCTHEKSADDMELIADGIYYVSNWNELKECLDNLMAGHDSLLEVRKKIMETNFYMPEGGAGCAVKNILKKDIAQNE